MGQHPSRVASCSRRAVHRGPGVDWGKRCRGAGECFQACS